MAHKKTTRAEDKFKRDALKMAKESLGHAIEWIDQHDASWAIVTTKRALAMLKAAQKV